MTANRTLKQPLRARGWLKSLLVGLCLLPTLAHAASTINLSFSPPTVNPGDASSISIVVINSGFNELTSTAITINLASGVTLSSTPTVSDSCGFGSISAPANGSTIILTGGTVPAAVPGGADGSCAFSVPVVSVGAGNHTTTVPANGPSNGFVAGGGVSGFSADDNGTPITNVTAASATLAISTLTNPSGAMSVSPSTVYVGETTTLTATLTNNNAGVTLPLTTFTPTLPAGLVLAANPGGSVNCTGTGAVNGTLTSPTSPGSLTAGDSSFTLSGGTIGAGGVCTVQVTLQVPASAGSVTVTAPLNAIGNTRGLGSAQFTRAITVSNPVSVSQATTPSTSALNPVRAGQPVSLRITLGNASANTPMSIVSFTNNLAAGLVVDAGVTPAVTCSGTGAVNGTVTATPGANTFTLANATAGKSGNCQVTVGVAMNAAGNLASTSATTVGAGTQITSAAVSPGNLTVPSSNVSVYAASAFTVAKAVSSASAYQGQALTYTVTLSNWSAGAASNVGFTDNLPSVGGVPMLLSAGSALGAGCSGGTFTATAGTSSVTWTGGTVASGTGTAAGTCTITIAASMPDTATVGDIYTNTLPTGTAVTGTNLASGSIANTAAASVNTTATASVTVAQSLTSASIVQGGTSTLRVTFTNPTPDPLTNTAFTETLNANVKIAATPAIAASSCAGTPVLTAVAGSGSFSVSGLTVPANSSTCKVSVNVTSTAVNAGTGWPNTIPVGAITNDLGLSNTAAATVNLKVTTALTATAAFSPSAVGLNGTSRLTLTLNNVSTIALSNVSVNNPLQTGGNAFVVAAVPNASTTCAGSPSITANAGASSMSMSGATMVAGTSCTLSFDVRMSAGTSWTDTIPAGNITSAEGAGNASAVTASASNALAVAAAFSPASTGLNGSSRLTITLTNSGAVPFTGAGFTSSMQSGANAFVLAATPGASTTCAGSPVITAVGGATSIALGGVTLAAGTNCALSFDVTTSAGGPWTYTLAAGAVTTAEGAASPSSATASLSKVTGSLGVNKSFNPISIVGGSSSTLQIDITNTAGSGSTANAVALTDTFPSGMEVHAVPGASTTCTNGVVSVGATSVTLSGADITVGATCSVFVNVTSVQPLNLTNTIDVGALRSRQGFSNTVATSASLSTLQGVGAEKSFSPMAVAPGQVSRLTIKLISTLNSVPLSNVSVTDTLPAGVVVAATPNISSTCTTPPTATAGSGSVAISGAGLAPQSNCTFALDVTASSTGSYTNTIPIGGVTSAESYANQSAAAATLTVMAAPTVSVAFGTPTIPSGSSSSLVFTITNNSGQTLTGLALSQSLPAGLSVAPTPASATTCTSGSVSATGGGGSITLSGASLGAGASCTFRANVTSNSAATYTAAVAVSALSTLQGITNMAGANASLVVLQFPTVAQSLSATSISPAGTTDLTVTLGNANASSITLSSALSVALPTVPGAVLVNTPNGLSNTCPGTPTATAGSGAFSVPSGATIPAGGCSFTLRLTASTLGSYTQTIAAGALQTSAGNSQNASTVSLTVTNAAPPTANSLGASVNDDAVTPQAIGPLAGSATSPATLTTYTLRSLPSASLGTLYCNGTAVASVPQNCGAAQVAFLPVAAAVGTASFTYTVTDSNASVSAPATVTITVNGPPSANAISLALNNDAASAVAIGPLSGTAQGSATLGSYRITSLPGAKLNLYCNAVLLNSVPTVCAANRVTVLPVAAPSGTATFNYTVSDSNGMASPAAVVTVSFNTPPTASAVTSAGINSDAASAQALSSLSGATTTAGATLSSYAVTTLPAAGTLYCNAVVITSVPSNCAANALSYRPNGTAVNPVTFSYTVTDSNGMSSAAAVFSIPLNLAPSANPINAAVNNNAASAVAIGPLSGTATGSATLASYRIASLPGVKLNVYCNAVPVSSVPTVCAANQVTVLPAAAPSGTATFNYTVTDSNGMASPAAAVTVSFNTPPAASAVTNASINSDATAAQALSSMAGATTTAGATLGTYTVTSLPAAGTLYCNAVAIASVPSNCAANALSYRPAGSAVNPITFSYTVTDSNRMTSAAAVFSIALNLAPSANAIHVAVNNNAASAVAIGPLSGTPQGSATLSSYRITSLPGAKLNVYCNAVLVSSVPTACAASQATVLPVAAPAGTATFNYTVTDSNGMASPAAVVTVSFNTPPTASAVTNPNLSSAVLTAQALAPMSGAATTSGATLTAYTVASLPTAGTLYCNAVAIASVPSDCAANALSYRTSGAAVNPVTFNYTVTDSNGMTSAAAVFSIPLNQAPSAHAINAAVNNNAASAFAIGPLSGTAQGSATLGSYRITSLPGARLNVYCNAVLVNSVPTVCAANQVTVLPVAAPSGTATFTYTVTDSNGMASPAAVVTVAFNTPPTASAVTNAAINSDAASAQALSSMSGAASTAGATLGSYTVTSLPAAGTLYCNAVVIASVPSNCAAQMLSYRPNGTAVNPVTFNYTVTDSNGMTSSAAVFSIPLNLAPAASDFSNAVNNDASSPVAIGPFAGQSAAGAPIGSATVTAAPANTLLYCNGARINALPATCAASGWSVLPQGGPSGTSTLLYRVTDANGMDSPAATGTLRWNTRPLASALSARLRATPTAQALPTLAGTTTTAGATLASYQVTALPPVAQGTLLCNGSALASVPAACAPSALSLQPTGAPGSATSFSYAVTDSNGQTSAPAPVSIVLGTPPAAQDLSLSDGRGVAAVSLAAMTGSASTPGAHIATFTLTSLPANGTLLCNGVTVSAVPAVCAPSQLGFQANTGATGSARFTFTVTDSDGLVSAPATVSILLQTPPVARALTAGPLDNARSTPQALPALAGSVTTEGATLARYTVTTLPAAASGTLWCDGVRLDAVPAACAADRLSWVVTAGATGSASFAYTVTDSNGQVSEPAAVTVALAGSPALTLAKRSGGLMTVGFDASYTLQVSNRSAYTATRAPITVVDTLPAGLDYQSAGGAGSASDWTCAYATDSRQVNCVTSAVVAPSSDAQAIVLKVRPNAAATGSATDRATLVNTATVSGGGEAADYANGSAPGAQPHVASDTQTVQNASTVSGSVWLDLNANGMKDPGEPLLEAASVRVEAWPAGTTAEQARSGTPMATALIDASGRYTLAVLPGSVQVRFVNVTSGGGMGAPVNGETPATRDQPSATGAAGVIQQGVIDQLQVAPGAVITEQSLPIDPQGFVYDAGTRLPVGGAVVTLMAQGAAVPLACLTGGPNPYVTASGGAFAGGYQFLVDFGGSGCAALSGSTFTLQVAAAGYRTPSTLIAAGDGTRQVFSPPAGVGAVAIVPNATIPTADDPTTYYLAFVLSANAKGVVNNHVPVDGSTRPGLAVTKTASKASVEIGDLVRYTVVVRNTGTAVLPALTVADQLPLGFKFVDGSATLASGATARAVQPGSAAPALHFALPGMAPGAVASLQYIVRVGVGGDKGDGINRVHVSAGTAVSADASARVLVSAGVFGAQACVAGKVFLDCNGNGVQDDGEPGVGGVRLWLETGVSITVDSDGKYSTCGLSPRTHSLKLDRSTLPEGTEPLITSQRNLGDAGSLLLDPKRGELLRADFALGQCTPQVLERVRSGARPPPRGSTRHLIFDSPAPADRSAP